MERKALYDSEIEKLENQKLKTDLSAVNELLKDVIYSENLNDLCDGLRRLLHFMNTSAEEMVCASFKLLIGAIEIRLVDRSMGNGSDFLILKAYLESCQTSEQIFGSIYEYINDCNSFYQVEESMIDKLQAMKNTCFAEAIEIILEKRLELDEANEPNPLDTDREAGFT